jgi:NAD(P)-dependent dehydrogenase (short-subunit alcohol dehydrogenase family)
MFVLTQAFLPQFIAQGGASIINIASIASSLKGVPNRVSYMSSKAAVIGLTKSVAFDYMKDGIRANAVCPGTVDSPSLHERAHELGEHDEVWKTFIARQPMGRMASPDEMAHIIVFLASDESAYATGANFIVDGGGTL